MTVTATLDPTLVYIVGKDAIGLVGQEDSMRFYLTPCCLASAKGSGDGIVCRSCYGLIDERLGGLPGQDIPEYEARYPHMVGAVSASPALTVTLPQPVEYTVWVAMHA